MRSAKRLIGYFLCIAVGITLLLLDALCVVDPFWSGVGAALIAVGALRFVGWVRYRKSEAYREKVDTETSDERNSFLRGRAWAWAGYLFILIAAVATIVFRIIGQELLSLAASYAICLMLILYWGAYLILRKKY